MNEQDYKNLIITYQQKSFDLFSQVVALEAKNSTLNQLVKELTEKIDVMTEEMSKKDKLLGNVAKTTGKKTPRTKIDSEEF